MFVYTNNFAFAYIEVRIHLLVARNLSLLTLIKVVVVSYLSVVMHFRLSV